MKIEQKMINELNQILHLMDCVFIVVPGTHNDCWEIALPSKMFVESFIISTTRDFDKLLCNFFKKFNIEITFNNTHNIFWAKS